MYLVYIRLLKARKQNEKKNELITYMYRYVTKHSTTKSEAFK